MRRGLSPAPDEPPHLLTAAMYHDRTHAVQQRVAYSITSSAATSRPGGTVRPSAFAVLRLTAVSNLVAACTGRSAGLSPRRMRSTYLAACRHMSTKSFP